MKTVKLALIGFGNAGRAFAKMLCLRSKEIEDTYKCRVIVTAIATKSRGTLIDEVGIDLMKACSDVESYGRFGDQSRGLCSKSAMDVIREADYDVMCELSPLDIFTGQPATDHIKGAFSRGKGVITANKGPIAWHFAELRKIADEGNLPFFYETTVMDGTPVFNLAKETLKMCKISEISGILNSTTNFILEEMERGIPYDSIIEKGKAMGFIEANPAMDIEGYDAAAKVTALLNVLMDADMTPDMVERKGIEDITEEDIKDAASRGKVIKLLCKGAVRDGKVEAYVKPVEVERNHILATVDSTTSIVTITTDLMGKISVVEHNPEIEQTAYGIFGDLLNVLEVM